VEAIPVLLLDQTQQGGISFLRKKQPLKKAVYRITPNAWNQCKMMQLATAARQ